MNIKILTVTCLTIALLSGCSDKEKTKSLTEGGMKCGASMGMANGSALLVKKKMNILNQISENDSRRECVHKAMSTKELYACVRVEETGRLSTKCSSDNTRKIPKKEIPPMKCEAGKCGNSM
ncbi:MAG: hypothetical protein KC427_03105 [Sulfurovum sp.]|uniref:hypothetical protein n=1 Tax=Sulfurovum sp. TaxID=1969726 RepID=UPI002867E795|nr:hypothetical protein [Sulfurovum sp.]MCO4844987.1 hypothetical protein [Sulfurovum sp.]